MKLILRYLGQYKKYVYFAITIKLASTISELLLPRILEHLIDDLVPKGNLKQVIAWGLLMFIAAIGARQLSVVANNKAIDTAHKVSYRIRQDLFVKTIRLSGNHFDTFGLPSLISRMTSDSYNVQSAVQQFQTLCVRSPIMLIGGVCVAMTMDFYLSMILVIMLPFLIAVVLVISSKGLPLYNMVQKKLDNVVRIMRENITGIRVVKALGKENFEKQRFSTANEEMARQDIKAASIMAVPGPFMQLCLNAGLTLVVILGAHRVNAGLAKPGMILAFLTYVNMITMGVMTLGRIFMTMTKAGASADRIDEVLQANECQMIFSQKKDAQPVQTGFICFEHVNFSYGEESTDCVNFAGENRKYALEDISFSIKKGESLGIIGPTGCGKTTIINLLMRFYDAEEGNIFVDGKDVRMYDKDELRSKFGVVFQSDMIFRSTLRENIRFGRTISDDKILSAVDEAMASDFINALRDGLDHEAAVKGANLSGGQKQRLLVARALAGNPSILVLDDASSALDYKTDADMRKAIIQNHPDSTMIMIAQRVSSVMNMSHIMVLDDGKCIGYGTHEELLKSCCAYRETYEVQMGAIR